MAPLDRLRKRDQEPETAPERGYGPEDRAAEEVLRARLGDDPNDVDAFDRLADLVRRHAAEGHEAGDPKRAADDAVWALAEEIAQSGRAWYPLIELARLSIDDDREVALRRLGTAAERDPSGRALGQGLSMLCQAGHCDDALGLGVGHWRPREHDIETGRQLVVAAVMAGRLAEARRHLDALSAHPDQEGVEQLRHELERQITRSERGAPARTERGDIDGGGTVVDVREGREGREGREDRDRDKGSFLRGLLRR